MEAVIRAGRPSDLAAFYQVSVLTGHEGGDATHLYDDLNMIGHIYSAPYLLHAPETTFVAEDAEGVLGYVVGVVDTRGFEAHLEQNWWPTLRAKYTNPAEAKTPDQQRAKMIHHPELPPEPVLAAFPSHLHMNLLPRGQRQGLGRKLLNTWVDTVAQDQDIFAHVGVNAANAGGNRFWRAVGFEPVVGVTDGVWLGQKFPMRRG